MDAVTRMALAGRAGDSAATHQFLVATYPAILRYCMSMVDAGSAEDLAQETCLRAVRSLRTYRGDASATTWVLGVARHVCLSHRRTMARRPRHAGLRPEDMPEVHPLAPDDAAAVDIGDLLARLSPERREAFVLTQLLDRRYDETAALCDCPVGTIRSRVARAREDLLSMLESGARDAGPSGGTAADGPPSRAPLRRQTERKASAPEG